MGGKAKILHCNNKIYQQRYFTTGKIATYFINAFSTLITSFIQINTTSILRQHVSLEASNLPYCWCTYPIAHIFSTLMRHLFRTRRHPTFIRGFKQTCLFLHNLCADSLWEAKCHSESFTQLWKVKAINALTSFDNIKSFAWEGHSRGTTLTLKYQHVVPMSSGSYSRLHL